jgi:hypothetical protein
MEFLDRLNDQYSNKESGNGPLEEKLLERGNEYLDEEFPGLSYVVSIKEAERQEPLPWLVQKK